MKEMKTGLLSSLVLAALLPAPATDASMVFDFQDGNGPVEIGAWDWQQTSFFARGGNLAVTNRALTQMGIGPCDTDPSACQFTVFTHARLTGATTPDSKDVNIPGLGSDFEITLTMAFTETVEYVRGAPGNFGTQASLMVDTTGTAFLNIFYDDFPNTNLISGFGFDDGTLIAASTTASSSSGLFFVTGNAPSQLDRSPQSNAASDDYGDGSLVVGRSQLTITGLGIQSELSYTGIDADTDFFRSLFGPNGMTFQNISLDTYTAVNPSDCFTGSTSSVAVGETVANGGGECDNVHNDTLYANQIHTGGLLPVIGNINGGSYDGTNPDFLAQTDFSNAFDGTTLVVARGDDTTPIPEPGILALSLLGLGSMGATRRLRFLKG